MQCTSKQTLKMISSKRLWKLYVLVKSIICSKGIFSVFLSVVKCIPLVFSRIPVFCVLLVGSHLVIWEFYRCLWFVVRLQGVDLRHYSKNIEAELLEVEDSSIQDCILRRFFVSAWAADRVVSSWFALMVPSFPSCCCWCLEQTTVRRCVWTVSGSFLQLSEGSSFWPFPSQLLYCPWIGVVIIGHFRYLPLSAVKILSIFVKQTHRWASVQCNFCLDYDKICVRPFFTFCILFLVYADSPYDMAMWFYAMY